MTDEEKLKRIIHTLNIDPVANISPDTMLGDIEEWDSMGKINMIDLINEISGKILRYDDMKDLERVADLMAMMR